MSVRIHGSECPPTKDKFANMCKQQPVMHWMRMSCTSIPSSAKSPPKQLHRTRYFPYFPGPSKIKKQSVRQSLSGSPNSPSHTIVVQSWTKPSISPLAAMGPACHWRPESPQGPCGPQMLRKVQRHLLQGGLLAALGVSAATDAVVPPSHF